MTTENDLKESENKNKEIFVKGLNWGDLKTTEKNILFSHNTKQWFQIPLNNISNIQHISNKNEIALEINQENDTENETLCELRLFIPEQDLIKKKQNDESEEILLKNETRAETIKNDIVKKAKIGSISNSIAHIQEIQMITPRGKFDLYFTKNFLKIHGPSFNYQILNKNILKVFLLPKIDKHNDIFVLQLSNPLIQGNTSYPFLVFQIDNEEETSIPLCIPPDDEDLKNLLGHLKNPLTEKLKDILAKLFVSLIKTGVILPSKNFNFSNGPFNKCSYRVNEGVLYPLERCMLFVHKPVIYIINKNIQEVNFARLNKSGGQQRTFDMIIKTQRDKFQFIGVDKNEMELLKNYFAGKKIKINIVDENYNNIDFNAYSMTSKKRRAITSNEEPELPSEKELSSDGYESSESSSYENDEDEDDDEEEEKGEKKEKKDKKDKKENKDKKEKGEKKEKKEKKEKNVKDKNEKGNKNNKNTKKQKVK